MKHKIILFACVILTLTGIKFNVHAQTFVSGGITWDLKNDPTFNSVSVPHGKHYELLTNDKQRQLYDAYYRASLPQYLGTNTYCNLYKFATVPSDDYFEINEMDGKFAEQAVIYDNPGKVEFTVCDF